MKKALLVLSFVLLAVTVQSVMASNQTPECRLVLSHCTCSYQCQQVGLEYTADCARECPEVSGIPPKCEYINGTCRIPPEPPCESKVKCQDGSSPNCERLLGGCVCDRCPEECKVDEDCVQVECLCANGTDMCVCPRVKCVDGQCKMQTCASEGKFTSGAVDPNYSYGCCDGLNGFDTQASREEPRLVGKGLLCYSPKKGEPKCDKINSKSEGWYYPSGELLVYEDCSEEIPCPMVECAGKLTDTGKKDSYGCPIYNCTPPCPGCIYGNDLCMAHGERVKKFYCSSSNEIKTQKKARGACEKNYECVSNRCVNSRCGYDWFWGSRWGSVFGWFGRK